MAMDPPFFALPPELVDEIVKHLDSGSSKELRSTCRFFSPSTTRTLFRRCILSPTKLDRASFINISRRPHLANAVQELVWYELGHDEVDPTDDEPLQLAEDTLWWHLMGVMEEQPSTVGIPDWLETALSSMANIQTFSSCPMSPMHIISTSGPALAQIVLVIQSRRNQHILKNSGFFRFLLPALRRPGCTVRKLVLDDEGMWSCLHRIRPSDAPAFQQLTHIHLGVGILPREDMDNIKTCLRAATNLESLVLSFKVALGGRTAMASRPTPQADARHEPTDHASFLCSSLSGPMWWPRLQRLELNEFLVRTEHQFGAVLLFLGTHSRTLSQLVLRNCEVKRRLLERMHDIPELRLKSILIVDETDDNVVGIPDTLLLRYVNGKESAPFGDEIAEPSSIFCSLSTLETEPFSNEDFEPQSEGPESYDDEEMATIVEHLLPGFGQSAASPAVQSAGLQTTNSTAESQIRDSSAEVGRYLAEKTRDLATANLAQFSTVAEYNQYFLNTVEDVRRANTPFHIHPHEKLLYVWYLDGLGDDFAEFRKNIYDYFYIVNPNLPDPPGLREVMKRAAETKDEVHYLPPSVFVKVRLGPHSLHGETGEGSVLSALRQPELMGRFASERLWLFVHPDGRAAIGNEPLEYFSDWEDGSDGESYGEEMDLDSGDAGAVQDDHEGSDDRTGEDAEVYHYGAH
ncbi:hypothetical protein GE09DRAFT_1228803 [Coniochaeta sp. 2T2.1]|nr:hypothetical protein GE09DRAFT_1228803 [Coniochaeta sp. 2T2.1]